VNFRKAVVGQDLVDGLFDGVGCPGRHSCPQVANDRLGLVVGDLRALLGISGRARADTGALQRLRDILDPADRRAPSTVPRTISPR
jgi:hypothetical protein